MIFRKENIKEMTTEDLNKVRVELLKKKNALKRPT